MRRTRVDRRATDEDEAARGSGGYPADLRSRKTCYAESGVND